MNKVLLNTVSLNQSRLNLVGKKTRKGGGGSGGGGNAPEGYETFMASDGEFLAADGEFYVKL